MLNDGTSTGLSDRDMVGFSNGTSTGLSDRGLTGSVTALRRGSVTSNKEIASPVRAKLSSPRRSCLTLSV